MTQLIVFGGGGSDIGGNCTGLRLSDFNLVVDKGVSLPGGKPSGVAIHGEGFEDPDEFEVVVTHAHGDHVGDILTLPEGVVINGSGATGELARLMLGDASHVNERKGFMDFVYPPEYIEAFFDDRYNVLQTGQKRYLTPDCWFKLLEAGHVLGSRIVLVKDRDFTILHTGNISCAPQRLTPGADFNLMSEDVPNGLDVLVLEATNGGKPSDSREATRLKMLELIHRVVLRGGGKFWLPSYALGKAQEVLRILADFRMTELIPDIPIYLDGSLAFKINNIYDRHAGELRWDRVSDDPFLVGSARTGKGTLFPGIQLVNSPEQREHIARSPEPCILVTSSGSMESKVAKSYLPSFAEEALNCICPTGHVFERTVADQILASRSGQMITLRTEEGVERFRRYCQIASVSLSAHASGIELVEVVGRLRPRQVVLVHGSTWAKQQLAHEIRTRYGCNVLIPRDGEEIDLTKPALAVSA